MAKKIKIPKPGKDGRIPFITRWTAEQYRKIIITSDKHDMSRMELIERKVFDLPLEKHPSPNVQ